ncbi:MAG: hypothetical protein CL840_09980 [Crocinitomicaceae bacterium]|nr:hypothetical protein [Crocinitomicaceae bacterium]|tara:strand:- start:26390 stop:27934 length:1545 start_codon:yes stop_codon:yes gene_type:complete
MYKLVATFFAIILLSACVKKEDFDPDRFAKTSWNPQIGFPLVHSVMGVQDLMGNTDSNAVTTEPSGLVVLRYDGGAKELSAEDFIQFPGNVFLNSVSGVPVIPRSYDIPVPFKFPGDTDMVFTKLVIESGNMQLGFNSGHQAEATFKFPTLTSASGTKLTTKVPMHIDEAIVDISGYTLELNSSGEFMVNVEIPTGVSGGSASLTVQLKDIVYKRIEGDLKNRRVQLPPDSVRLHVFKNLVGQGELFVVDPRIRMEIENGFGVPLALDLSDMEAYYSVTNSTAKVVKPGQSVFNIIQGSAQSPGASTVELNKSNSNLSSVLQPTPVYFRHTINAESNPGSTGTNANVLEREAKLTARTILELPLNGRIKGLRLMDTIPFAINESFDYIKDLAINTAIKNGFPFTIKLSLRLLDSNYRQVETEAGNPVFLMKDREIATSGTVVSSTGKIDQSNLATVVNVYQLGVAETDAVLGGRFVRIEGELETFNGGASNVAIYDNYIFDLKVGTKITGNINF